MEKVQKKLIGEIAKYDPAYNSESEQVIIGSLLQGVGGNRINELGQSSFYNPVFGQIFFYITQGKLISTPFELADTLSAEELASVGGIDYLTELSYSLVPTDDYFDKALIILKNQKNIREIKKILAEEYHFITSDSDKYTTDIIYKLNKIQSVGTGGDILPFNSACEDLWRRVKSYKNKTSVFYKTGLKSIDEHFEGGLHKRGFYVLAARTHIGKTDFAMEIAIGLLNNGYRVRYDMLELTPMELYENILSKLMGISRGFLVSGKIPNEKYAVASATMEEWGNRLSSANNTYSVEELEQWLKKHRDEIDVLIIDQFSFLKKTSTEFKMLDKINVMIRQLLRLTIDFELPIILLHQINRSGVNADGSEPEMHNLKDSGHLEETADVVMVLNRPNMKSTGIEKTYADLIIKKDRLAQKAGKKYPLRYSNFRYVER